MKGSTVSIEGYHLINRKEIISLKNNIILKFRQYIENFATISAMESILADSSALHCRPGSIIEARKNITLQIDVAVIHEYAKLNAMLDILVAGLKINNRGLIRGGNITLMRKKQSEAGITLDNQAGCILSEGSLRCINHDINNQSGLLIAILNMILENCINLNNFRGQVYSQNLSLKILKDINNNAGLILGGLKKKLLAIKNDLLGSKLKARVELPAQLLEALLCSKDFTESAELSLLAQHGKVNNTNNGCIAVRGDLKSNGSKIVNDKHSLIQGSLSCDVANSDKFRLENIKNFIAHYLEQLGGDVNLVKAANLYEEAANRDYLPAVTELIRCHENEIGVKRNQIKIVANYEKLLAKTGGSRIKCLLAASLEGLGGHANLARAVALYEEAANDAYIPAIEEVIRCYANGVGVKRDSKKVIQLYKKFARAGDARSQYLLASHFEQLNSRANLNKAVAWFEVAANAGYLAAQLDVARCYEKAIAVNKNLATAAAWYERAARQGDVSAQHQLALCLMQMPGIKNLQLAAGWLEIASLKGYVPAKNSFHQLLKDKPNLKIIRPDLTDQSVKAKLKAITGMQDFRLQPADQRKQTKSLEENRYDLILKARQAGYSVLYETLPIAGERIAYTAQKLSQNEYHLSLQHWDPYFGKKIAISKILNLREKKALSLSVPGRDNTLLELDQNGKLSLKIQEAYANIVLDALVDSQGPSQFSEIRREGKIHLQSDNVKPLNLTQIHSSQNVSLEASQLNYEMRTFCVAGSLNIQFNESQNIIKPIYNPGSLKLIFTSQVLKPIHILADIKVASDTRNSKRNNQELDNKLKANVRDAKEESDFNEARDSKEKKDVKKARDAKEAADIKDEIDIKQANDNQHADNAKDFGNDRGAGNAKDVNDDCHFSIESNQPIIIGSLEKPVKLESGGTATLQSPSLCLLNGMIVSGDNTFLNAEKMKLGILTKDTLPSAILSGGSTTIAANEKLELEGLHIFSQKKLTIRSEKPVDNLSTDITVRAEAEFITPLFTHRLNYIGDGNYQRVSSAAAKMRIAKTLKISGDMLVVGSSELSCERVLDNQLKDKKPQDKVVPEYETVTKQRMVKRRKRGMFGANLDYLDNEDYQTIQYGKVHAPIYSFSSNLVVQDKNIDIAGILSVVSLRFEGFDNLNIGRKVAMLTVPSALFRTNNPLFEGVTVNPLFEARMDTGPIIMQPIIPIYTQIDYATVFILGLDGYLKPYDGHMKILSHPLQEEQAVVDTLMQTVGRAFISENAKTPKEILPFCKANAKKHCSQGLHINVIKEPLLVYEEISYLDSHNQEHTVLRPNLKLPATMNNARGRNSGGYLYALRGVELRGNRNRSRFTLTGSLQAEASVDIANLHGALIQRPVFEQTTRYVDTQRNKNLIAGRTTHQLVDITTHTALDGGEISANSIHIENVGSLNLQGAKLNAEGEIVAQQVAIINAAPTIESRVQEYQTSAKNRLISRSAIENLSRHRINPTTITSAAGSISLTAGVQNLQALACSAKNIELNATQELNLLPTIVSERMPSRYSINNWRSSTIRGEYERGLACSMQAKQVIQCISKGNIYIVGSEMLAFTIELKADKEIEVIPLILRQWIDIASNGLRGLTFYSQTTDRRHETGMLAAFFARQSLSITSKEANVKLVAPLLIAEEQIKLSAPKGTVFLEAAAFYHDISSSEIATGLSFLGSQTVEAMMRQNFREAAFGLLREFPLLASMEQLRSSADVADISANGMMTLYQCYKSYKAFSQASNLKEFINSQVNPNVSIKMGLSTSEQSWMELALPWLQARNIIMEGRDIQSQATQANCENLTVTADNKISFEAAEQRARSSSNSAAGSLGISQNATPNIGLAIAASEQRAIEYIHSHFNVSGLTTLVAGGKISLAGVCIETLKAVLMAESLDVKTVQDVVQGDHVSANVSIQGSLGLAYGRQDTQVAKEQTSIKVKETLLINIQKQISLMGGKLEVGNQAKIILAQSPDGKPNHFYELDLPLENSLLSFFNLDCDKISTALYGSGRTVLSAGVSAISPILAIPGISGIQADSDQASSSVRVANRSQVFNNELAKALETHFAFALWNNKLPDSLQTEQTNRWAKALTENAANWQAVSREISEKLPKKVFIQFLINRLNTLTLQGNEESPVEIRSKVEGHAVVFAQGIEQASKQRQDLIDSELPYQGTKLNYDALILNILAKICGVNIRVWSEQIGTSTAAVIAPIDNVEADLKSNSEMKVKALQLLTVASCANDAETINLRYLPRSQRWTVLHDQPGLLQARMIHGSDVIDHEQGNSLGINFQLEGGDVPVKGTSHIDLRLKKSKTVNHATISSAITVRANIEGSINRDISLAQEKVRDENYHIGGFLPLGDPKTMAEDARNVMTAKPIMFNKMNYTGANSAGDKTQAENFSAGASAASDKLRLAS